jgi:putative transposase
VAFKVNLIGRDVTIMPATTRFHQTRRTAQRWLARYRANGLAGLVRSTRQDLGLRRVTAEVIECIEGLILRKPRPSIAAIRRRLLKMAVDRQWVVPSYSSIYQIIRRLDSGLVTWVHGSRHAPLAECPGSTMHGCGGYAHNTSSLLEGRGIAS